MKDMMVLDDYTGDMSYESCSRYLQDNPGRLQKEVLVILHQIECNPRIESLRLAKTSQTVLYTKLLRIISANCPSIKELQFSEQVSIDDINAALDVFPAVDSLTIHGQSLIKQSILSFKSVYANITKLIVIGDADTEIAALCLGFPKLQCINLGQCEPSLMSTILAHCPRIVSFRLYNTSYTALNEADIISLFTVIVQYGSFLKELQIGECSIRIVTLQDSKLEIALIKTINRMDSFQVHFDIRNKHNISIFTLPHVHAQVTEIDTLYYISSNEVPTSLMKKSKTVRSLDLRFTRFSGLVSLIPTCSMLSKLYIFDIKITAGEMKSILLSCPHLSNLKLAYSLTAEVLESIALHGRNLISLYVNDIQKSSKIISFSACSALWSCVSCNKNPIMRRKRMIYMCLQYLTFDPISAKLFLSWFDRIDYIDISISVQHESNMMLPIHPLTNRVTTLSVNWKNACTSSSEDVFLDVVEGCQRLTHLQINIEQENPFDGDKILAWANEYNRCQSSSLRNINYFGNIHFTDGEMKISGIKVKRKS
jgi:hypothetical protein